MRGLLGHASKSIGNPKLVVIRDALKIIFFQVNFMSKLRSKISNLLRSSVQLIASEVFEIATIFFVVILLRAL